MRCECGCGQTIKNPKPGQRFYNAACRARKWREDHIPHCPRCGTALEVHVGGAPGPPLPRVNAESGEVDHERD